MRAQLLGHTTQKGRVDLLFYYGQNKMTATSHPHLELLFLKQHPCKDITYHPSISQWWLRRLLEAGGEMPEQGQPGHWDGPESEPWFYYMLAVCPG